MLSAKNLYSSSLITDTVGAQMQTQNFSYDALDRLEHRKRYGDSDHAFGWAHLPEARFWRSHACTGSEA